MTSRFSRFGVSLVAMTVVGCAASNPGQPASLDSMKETSGAGFANRAPVFSVADLDKVEYSKIPESEIPTPEQVKALIPEKLTPEQADRLLLTVPEDKVMLSDGDRQIHQIRGRHFGGRFGGHFGGHFGRHFGQFPHHRFFPFHFRHRTFFSPFFFDGSSFLSPFAFDPFLVSPVAASPFISTVHVSPFISSFGFNPFISPFSFHRGFFRHHHRFGHHRFRR